MNRIMDTILGQKTTFDVLLLLGRPAAGKSEIIDQLKSTNISERIERYHIGNFEEIDDFPMLWTWYEEDALLSKMGHPHLHTDEKGYFIGKHLWNLLIERLCLEYKKKLRDDPDYLDRYTSIIEFSRGKEHGGFKSAFSHLSPQILKKMAILYISVTWEESLRKNQARFNPNRPDSILEHGIPEYKMEKLYKYSDWDEESAANSKFIDIRGFQIPYVVFENEDDVTTLGGEALAKRLGETLGRLWHKYNHLKTR